MPDMDMHRKVAAKRLEVISLLPPFSFFDFAEDRFEASESIRRIFSLARSSKSSCLLLEEIPAVGIVQEEIEDILERFPHYRFSGLFRLSFWKDQVSPETIEESTDNNLIGYAILKHDVTGGPYDGWHIFEAVFTKYPHHHNCVPLPKKYELSVSGKVFSATGILYCQQNTLNKTCAQVALRSLLSRLLPNGDISYRTMNAIAKKADPGYVLGKGLLPLHFEKILEEFGLRFHDIDYSSDDQATDEERAEKLQLKSDSPYQKFVYSGLESGGGALVGFCFKNAEGEERGHIIPIYGHTFNQDNWAPDANFSYFRIGHAAGYLPSEIWTSSFIGHDDNFGPNFCIPRLYIQKENVEYVLEIFRPGIKYSGLQAEAIALNAFNMIIGNVHARANRWISRLQYHSRRKRLVFRALALSRDEYISHLRTIVDWDNNNESVAICNFFAKEIPDFLWVVEVSTPQLFPTNQRKLGEVVLNGGEEIENKDLSINNDLFIFARIPGYYMVAGGVDESGSPIFSEVKSNMTSHTELFRL